MLESLRCPGCSTRYGLRAERVRPGVRRARCFRCQTVFDIEEPVARLLALPESEAPVPAPLPEPDPLPEAELHFGTAKDAIDQLMGEVPPTAPPPVRIGSPNAMDVEATLDALETSLTAPAPPTEPAPAAAPFPKMDLASTVKLTSEQIREAMSSAGTQLKPPLPPAPHRIEAAPQPPPPLEEEPEPEHELLKVQLDQETCENVSLDQMTTWIEQGRVRDFHMVARQFSGHWIEAGKVPALRPVFDRMRKDHPIPPDPPIPPTPEKPAKRGLFAGLFGRN